ncbi:MAG: ECF-type sigma factor [Acidobacteriota bacterium]
MSVSDSNEITALLRAWRQGDREAEGRLVTKLYPQLRALAQREVAKRSSPSLRPTEIVHELYLRLRRGQQPEWQGRTHFLAISSRLIRNILVDRARGRNAKKRGQGVLHIQLDPALPPPAVQSEDGVDLLEFDDALGRLAAKDSTAARIVELRFFGGLEIHETAAVLDTSPSTVVRKWRFAKAWLRRDLSAGAVV